MLEWDWLRTFKFPVPTLLASQQLCFMLVSTKEANQHAYHPLEGKCKESVLRQNLILVKCVIGGIMRTQAQDMEAGWNIG